MASIFCCLKGCLNGFDLGMSAAPVVQRRTPLVTIDNSRTGQEVVIVKNGSRICGTGGALGSAPLVQNKAYFEVKLQQSGIWGVGVATEKTNLNQVPMGNDSDSWVLSSDGVVRHSKEELHKVSDLPQEGDVIGVTYDHVELNFYVHGKNLNCPVSHIRGTLYPALYVDDGAILDVIFADFTYTPPPGYDNIMIEQSLLET
nr:EOG090X0EPP [Lepidurus arcticus]